MLEIDKIQKRFPQLTQREIVEMYDRDITKADPVGRPSYRHFPQPPPPQGELFKPAIRTR